METASPNDPSSPDPASAEAQNDLGIALAMKGRLDEAIASFNRAIQLNPGYAPAYNNLANALRGKGQTREAIAILRQAINLNPNFAAAHNNLGIALKDAGQLDDAIASYRRALTIDPNNADALCNLGVALSDQDRLDEAIDAYQRAVELRPGFPEALNNLGTALKDNAQLEKAIAAFDRAIELNPQYAAAHWNRALTWLLLGDYKRGWPEYEWRKQMPAVRTVSMRKFPQPQWDGGELAGRAIYLYPEQGLGDTLQFIRYAPLVAARGGRIIVEHPPELARLIRDMPGISEFASFEGPLPKFDVHASFLSLPLLFSTEIASIPAPVPYLMPGENLVKQWKRKFGPLRQGLRVGLVWAGNPNNPLDRGRSINLREFAPLAEIPGIDFWSIQLGDPSRQLAPPGLRLIDWTDELHDFADTAALIANLDLVITVETAVAHLAGAMGKQVWVLLRKVPPWRWLMDREDSPWYPTMQLFRQKTRGDWPSVIRLVTESLRNLRR
ncbi:MAG TPA: tetratricopeptide repeat-containing glycosyltransferase family protein [Tepidisphaeraceae bacterium]